MTPKPDITHAAANTAPAHRANWYLRGLQRALLLPQHLSQPVTIGALAFLADQVELAISTALHDSQRNTIKVSSRATGYPQELAQEL